MNYDPKDIESYILLSCDPQRKRSIERQLLYVGRLYSFWIVIGFALFNVLAVFNDYPINPLPFNIIMVSSLPIVILLAIKLCRFSLKNIRKYKRSSSYIAAFAFLGAAVGSLFPRFLAGDTFIIVLGIIGGFMIYVFVLIVCGSYFKLYLLRKYCPHLKDRTS